MSYSRVNSGVGASAGGAAGGLTDAQTAAVNNVMLGDIDDFTADIANYWQFGVPDVQATGTYAVTTYSKAADGLTMVVSHSDTKFNGSGLAKPVGFWRMLHAPDFDIAIDIDNIGNLSSYFADEWDVTLAVCIGGSGQDDSMFAARLQSAGGGWTAARVVKPTFDEQWLDGSEDELTTGLTGFDAATPPSSVRLRIQHSNANSGYKAYYSLDGGSTYTTLEGANGGTGWYQMHAKDSAVGGTYNRYSMGGAHCAIVAVAQNHKQSTASQQGTCRVKFKDLAAA